MTWLVSNAIPFVLALVAFVVLGVLNDLAKGEIRGWIERVPYGLLRLARRRLPPELRETVHDEEWVPELSHILERSEGLPITRLVTGIGLALGLLCGARPVADHLGSVRARLPTQQTSAPSWVRFLAGFVYGVVTEAGSGILRMAWLALDILLLIIHGPSPSLDGGVAGTPEPRTDRPPPFSKGRRQSLSPQPRAAAVEVEAPQDRNPIADLLSQRVVEDRTKIDRKGPLVPEVEVFRDRNPIADLLSQRVVEDRTKSDRKAPLVPDVEVFRDRDRIIGLLSQGVVEDRIKIDPKASLVPEVETFRDRHRIAGLLPQRGFEDPLSLDRKGRVVPEVDIFRHRDRVTGLLPQRGFEDPLSFDLKGRRVVPQVDISRDRERIADLVSRRVVEDRTSRRPGR